MAAQRVALVREKEKELAKLEAVHAKQLKARDEEMAQFKATITKERDERLAKQTSTIKDLKGSVASAKDLKATVAAKDTEIAGLRKQLGAAQRVEDELRKQLASVASDSMQEKHKNDAIAKLRGSIEHSHSQELKRQSDEHEQALASRNREVVNLTAQLKQMLIKYQQAQGALQRERDKVREALLASRSLAEVSMDYSGEQEERLLAKLDGSVQDCSVEEVHWLMTRTFRSWLAQSYNECDEVCDALEAEQQRLKRIYHSKEQELGKMRAHASHLKSRIVQVYQISLLAMLAIMATGCVGAWRSAAISSGFWPSLQLMGFAWFIILATALLMLFSDGSATSMPAPSPLAPARPCPVNRDRDKRRSSS